MKFSISSDALSIDCAAETKKIIEVIRKALAEKLHRRGIVVGISGGIDSSVTLALCVRAIGAERVVALQMPERHSSKETLPLSQMLADHFGVRTFHEDISGILESAGFYRRYDEAVARTVPGYGAGWKSKIVLPSIVESSSLSIFFIVAQSPSGEVVRKRLPLSEYLAVVAATNFKQRTRKMLEYYYADLYNYAVAGTPNRLEYDQGFFVKLGDGAADVKPIAHLYKSQVYQMAAYLDVPETIRKRSPTTDTYSLPQGQDEFYFVLPYDKMDLCLWGRNNGVSSGELAQAVGISVQQVERVYRDIDSKRAGTVYLHAAPVLIEAIPQIAH